MNTRCDKCGSGNHQAYDCRKEYDGWREREPALERVLPRQDPEPATLTLPAAKNAPQTDLGGKAAVLGPPRWPGGPETCASANLPRFRDAAEADAFHAANGPGLVQTRRWACDSCGGVHYLVAYDRDGAVSGPLPARAGFPFLRDPTRREMDERAHRMSRGDRPAGDLPAQKLERSAPVALPKAVKTQQENLW